MENENKLPRYRFVIIDSKHRDGDYGPEAEMDYDPDDLEHVGPNDYVIAGIKSKRFQQYNGRRITLGENPYIEIRPL